MEFDQHFSKKCWNCGHTLMFYAISKDCKLCNWCGRYNYRNKNAEFKHKLNIEMIKGKGC